MWRTDLSPHCNISYDLNDREPSVASTILKHEDTEARDPLQASTLVAFACLLAGMFAIVKVLPLSKYQPHQIPETRPRTSPATAPVASA